MKHYPEILRFLFTSGLPAVRGGLVVACATAQFLFNNIQRLLLQPNKVFIYDCLRLISRYIQLNISFILYRTLLVRNNVKERHNEAVALLSPMARR